MILASADVILAHPLYVRALVLVLLGAFTKWAQIPFHFWLPPAMSRQPGLRLSAFRDHGEGRGVAGGEAVPGPAGGTEWTWLVSGRVGHDGVRRLLALFRHDLKGLLAYSTVSHLGMITLLFGVGSRSRRSRRSSNHEPCGLQGVAVHERRYHRSRGGHPRYPPSGRAPEVMPNTRVLAMVAAAAMAGVPLFNGLSPRRCSSKRRLHGLGRR